MLIKIFLIVRERERLAGVPESDGRRSVGPGGMTNALRFRDDAADERQGLLRGDWGRNVRRRTRDKSGGGAVTRRYDGRSGGRGSGGKGGRKRNEEKRKENGPLWLEKANKAGCVKSEAEARTSRGRPAAPADKERRRKTFSRNSIPPMIPE
jgi:hypothetical protein